MSGFVVGLLLGCKPQKELSVPTNTSRVGKPDPVRTQLSGQVFIVLENRETLKLSLVDIRLVDGKLAAGILDGRPSWPTADETSLRSEIVRVLPKLLPDSLTNNQNLIPFSLPSGAGWDKHLSALVKSSRVIQPLIQSTDSSLSEARELTTTAQAATQDDYIRAVAGHMSPDDRVAFIENNMKVYREISAKEGALEMLSYKLQHYSSVVDEAKSDFLKGLETATIRTVTTDVDGKFTIAIPSGEDRFIFAYVKRNTGNLQEEYMWLIPIEGGTEQTLVLANNNLL